tara:strand:+ start:21 stop:4541 length:4521 start_codon:yes stop_codon:yes gene_type:complete
MAEVKNAFIKSKMNKDLDSRLLPSGEYRDGFNIQVSKSEGEDVGALENALGNSKALIDTSENNPVAVDFSVLAGHATGTLKSIGMYSDIVSSTIFVFLTDYTDLTFPGSLTYSSTALNYIYSYNTLTRQANQLVSGAYLNFSKTNPINAVNTLENLLFWTDNRNQPRKINVSTASNPSYYNSEDLISIAKYNPYEVIELYYQDTNQFVPNSTSVVNPNLNQWVCAAQDVTSSKLPDGTTDNMYYDTKWPGDPDYLKSKFVSFSYRFKFSDGEYSILAPFTQEAFIPQQDGYFLDGDEDSAYRSSIVEFMRNKVTNVKLHIPLPVQGQNLESTHGISQIEIIWKESDSLTVKVLDSVPVSNLVSSSNDFYLYDYQSRKPYKTLPESEIIRVYDKVPVRALSQEIISNRVVYGNFQDKHTPPATINYDIAVTEKSTFSVSGTNTSLFTTSEIEYPEHTLKQNRNYQVGIVLSDRYGRQSTTILSPIDTQIKTITTGGNDLTFKGSTYYHPYKGEPVAPSTNDIHSWPGDSLKVLVNAGVNSTPNITTGTPGLYNGDATNAAYNPLGWYSYKIVIKQTETDYYNVYLPGILNDYPDYTSNQRSSMPDPENTIAHISLISDNINKVPRDLTEVGPEQLQYRSGVKLFGRVTPNFILDTAPTYNEPYYPKDNTMTVASISEQNNMFLTASRTPPYSTIYQTDSDPYVARISQNNVSVAASTPLPGPIGSSQVNSITGYTKNNILLGVFETAPFESLLDIFYETSTTGLVSDFNLLAGNDNGTLAGWNTFGVDGFDFTQTEATVAGAVVVQDFTATLPSNLGDPTPIVDAEIKLINVSDGLGTTITSDWSLVDGADIGGNQTYNLIATNPRYFETDILKNTFIFTFSVINKSDPNNIVDYGDTVVPAVTLTNIGPNITEASRNFPAIPTGRTDPNIPIHTFLGTNGTVVAGKTSANLTWSIDNQTPTSTPLITINPSDGQVFAPLDVSGAYSFRVTVTDSGGASYFIVIGATAGKQPMNASFGKYVPSDNTQNQISKGLQSTGFFWCDDYSTALSDPYPNGFNGGTVSGRTAGKGDLSLLQSGFNNTSSSSQVAGPIDLTVKDEQDNVYRMANKNFKTSYRDTSVSNGGNSLTSGTAFLKVDFKFRQWPFSSFNTSKELSGQSIRPQYNTVSWTAYLQKRPSGGSWQYVLDVEGNQILFGSEQININNASLNDGSGGNDFAKTGVLKNPTSYQITGGYQSVDSNRIAQDSVGATAWFPQTYNAPSVSSTVSKVFVFGKDQGYEQTADQYGDYRLLILYPVDGGQSGVPNQADPPSRVIPPILASQASWSARNPYSINGASFTDTRITVDISYGDFYYPPFTESSNEVYAYRVSPTGLADRDQAEATLIGGGSPTVYAREWSLKYVTQFFSEPSLTQKWVPGTRQGDYYVYQSVQELNGINSKYGTENSSFKSLPADENDMSASNNSERKYTAQFDTDGKKIIGSALPLAGGASEDYEPTPTNPDSTGGGNLL